MSAFLLVVVLAVAGLALLLAFRRRTLWFVIERRRQALEDAGLDASARLEVRLAAVARRIPARVRSQASGMAVGAFLGAGMLALFGLGLVLGESGLAVETVCMVMACDASLPLLPDPGLSFALSLVAGAIFWGMVLLELIGKTHFSDWIRSDNLEAAERPDLRDPLPPLLRSAMVPSVAAAMLGVCVALLVSLAVLRGVYLSTPGVAASQESFDAFRAGHRTLILLQQAGGALLVTASAAFGLLAMKDFLNLIGSTVLFGVLSSAVWLFKWCVGAAVYLLDLLMGLLQDLVHIVDPGLENRLALPNGAFAGWEEPPVEGGDFPGLAAMLGEDLPPLDDLDDRDLDEAA